MKSNLKIVPAILLATVLLQGCGASHEDSKLTTGGDDLQLTGRLRASTSGSQQGIQIDLKNVSNQLMFGPTVSVQIDGVGFFGQGAVYPYFGGNTSTANTIFPNDQGYIPLKLSSGSVVQVGQTFSVTIRGYGASNISEVRGTVVVCQKGSTGCE